METNFPGIKPGMEKLFPANEYLSKDYLLVGRTQLGLYFILSLVAPEKDITIFPANKTNYSSLSGKDSVNFPGQLAPDNHREA